MQAGFEFERAWDDLHRRDLARSMRDGSGFCTRFAGRS